MKKPLIIFISIMICIITILFVFLRQIEAEKRAHDRINIEYQEYLDKEIYGIQLATIINKVISSNEKNEVTKDQEGMYVDNGLNSILVDIYISDNNTTYKMENIYKLGTSEFLQHFNTIMFKGKIVEYHDDTGQIAKILFEQIVEETNEGF